MSTRIRASYAEIRLSSLAHNFKFLRSLLKGHKFICPMIKSDAYGHGDIECARTLIECGAHDLGVALVEEGIHLRESGIGGSILVFGPFSREAISEIIKYNLTPVLSRFSDLHELEEQVPTGAVYRVHLKFNTGMNRLGFIKEDLSKVLEHFKNSKKLLITGVCTHLLQGEDSFDLKGRSQRQIHEFEDIISYFDSPEVSFHALNSSALCSQSFSGFGARPGIALYGASPALQKDISLDLRPVMSIKSKIELVQKVKKGATVSYGGTWTAQRDSKIGIIPFGYADGYPRAASNKSSMLVRGKRVPVRGTVCMDYIMIDLTDVGSDDILEGEEVVLIGSQENETYTIDELASLTNTISYELFTRVTSRVPRVYLHEAL